MKDQNPLVSVLICSHNAEKFIESTIQSVLGQTHRNIEVLVLDNASADKTLELLADIQRKDSRLVIITSKTNHGPYQGLNILLDKAKGTYIAINDHDDVWYPEKLEKQVSFLERHKEFVGCGSAIINWYEKYNTYLYRSQQRESDIAWHTSLVFRNGEYRYDTTVKIATDFYFMKNILCKNKKQIHNFQEPFVLRRIFKESNNLSGRWMKRVSPTEIMRLNIGLIDKFALLNRVIFPQEWVEWALVRILANNVPAEYVKYAKYYDQEVK